LDKSLNLINFDINQSKSIGVHDEPIKSVLYDSTNSIAITGSWDKTFKTWDIRSKNPMISCKELGEKVHSMSLENNKLFILKGQCNIEIYDIR